jgi:hypothetical protein
MQQSSSPRGAFGLAVCLLIGAVSAQRPIFTVGGSAPDFTSLPAAVSAVPPGSILVVGPGTWTGFTTAKPLRIVFDFAGPNGAIVPPAGAGYAIRVQGLPPGDEFVLEGRGSTVATGGIGAIRIANCFGPVILDGLNVAPSGNRLGLDVQNANAVHARRSVFAGAPGLQVEYANLTLSECIVLGTSGVGAYGYNARFDATRTFFSGVAQPALRLFDCAVRIASDGSSTIAVGGAGTEPVSAIEAFECQLQFDATRIGLLPANGAPGLAQLGSVVQNDDVPTLTASVAPAGSLATARMVSNTPRPGLVVLGGLLPSPVLFDLTNIFVDTVTAPTVAAIGICDATGLVASAQIPTTAAVIGTVTCLQGVVWQPSGWPVLSSPALWVVL